jgi:CIC family chloride channel protein
VQSYLLSPPLFSAMIMVFVCKLLAVLASSVSGGYDHASIMSMLMISGKTGQYVLLPGLLIASVLASVRSRTLRRDSLYRHHLAEHR